MQKFPDLIEINNEVFENADKYTQSQWTDMETNGAVFLPAAGTRLGTGVVYGYVNAYGYYWTKTYYGETGYTFVVDQSDSHFTEARTDMSPKNFGCAVRLVQDYQE